MMSTNTSHWSTSSTKVSNALRVLAQMQWKKEAELNNVSSDAIHVESDNEIDLA